MKLAPCTFTVQGTELKATDHIQVAASGVCRSAADLSVLDTNPVQADASVGSGASRDFSPGVPTDHGQYLVCYCPSYLDNPQPIRTRALITMEGKKNNA